MLWPLALVVVVVGCTVFVAAAELNQADLQDHFPETPPPAEQGETSPLLRRRKEMAWEMV
ncbi:MAG: hypothetical protein CL450_06580 [Acidimicrobiaceae bacterium]|nr:hypothetical protein [Acidimicrobiaceae bacterium]|tara:strand:- start:2126 stop:2305 length:180 start_codon:yes stop_codon:yes gene_type:complete